MQKGFNSGQHWVPALGGLTSSGFRLEKGNSLAVPKWSDGEACCGGQCSRGRGGHSELAAHRQPPYSGVTSAMAWGQGLCLPRTSPIWPPKRTPPTWVRWMAAHVLKMQHVLMVSYQYSTVHFAKHFYNPNFIWSSQQHSWSRWSSYISPIPFCRWKTKGLSSL